MARPGVLLDILIDRGRLLMKIPKILNWGIELKQRKCIFCNFWSFSAFTDTDAKTNGRDRRVIYKQIRAKSATGMTLR